MRRWPRPKRRTPRRQSCWATKRWNKLTLLFLRQVIFRHTVWVILMSRGNKSALQCLSQVMSGLSTILSLLNVSRTRSVILISQWNRLTLQCLSQTRFVPSDILSLLNMSRTRWVILMSRGHKSTLLSLPQVTSLTSWPWG